jgi:hypothetical protein
LRVGGAGEHNTTK